MGMWASAVYDLGLTTQQFWKLTPRKFQALCERWENGEKRQRDRAALIGFYLYNAMGAKKAGGQAFSPADFGLEGNASMGERPTLNELLEAQRMGEEMLKARDEGRPNPFLPDPNAEGLKLNAETVLKVTQ